MRKSIVWAIVLMIVTVSVISMSGLSHDQYKPLIIAQDSKTVSLDEALVISLYLAPGFIGVNMDIENSGTTTLNNVEWSFRTKAAITGTGIFITETLQGGIINQLEPGETITIEFKPFITETKSPVGFGNLYMNASANVNDISVRTQQRVILFGIFVIQYKDTYMDIKPKEAYEKWLNNDFDLIIDVVGLDIYSLGHLPGAVNYIWADGTLNEMIPTLDPTWTFLVYCHTDPPSTDSAQSMVDAGFDQVYRLEGNYKAWKDAGYPIEP